MFEQDVTEFLYANGLRIEYNYSEEFVSSLKTDSLITGTKSDLSSISTLMVKSRLVPLMKSFQLRMRERRKRETLPICLSSSMSGIIQSLVTLSVMNQFQKIIKTLLTHVLRSYGNKLDFLWRWKACSPDMECLNIADASVTDKQYITDAYDAANLPEFYRNLTSKEQKAPLDKLLQQYFSYMQLATRSVSWEGHHIDGHLEKVQDSFVECTHE